MAESDSSSELNRTSPEGGSPPGEKESAEELPILPQILLVAQLRLERVSPDLLFKQFDDRLEVLVPVEQLIPTCRALRDDLEYRMLMSITAVDWKTSFELVYHLYRLDSPYPVVLRCNLPHDESPQAPSVIGVWRGAEFQEREIYDLMGIVFTGHPDLRRILLADDFQGHPLRKDFQQDPNYVLVPHLRVPGYSGAKRGEASTGRFVSE